MHAKASPKVQPELDGLAERLQSSSEAKNPLTLLATQYAHAVRNVLPGDPLREQDGHVQYMRQTTDLLDTRPGQRTDPHFPDRLTKDEAIVAEAARVKTKFASVDAKTDVVLRFDFMNEKDTKARKLQDTGRHCTYLVQQCIAAGCKHCDVCCHTAGRSCPDCRVYFQNESGKWHSSVALTLSEYPEQLAQSMRVAMCMQNGSSDEIQRNIVSVWNIAIGGVCLMLMSAIMAVFAWRIIQANRQNKTWYVYKGALVFIAVTFCYCSRPTMVLLC